MPPVTTTLLFTRRTPPAFAITGSRASRSFTHHRFRASSREDESSSVPDSLPLAGVDTDWRAFRAKLVAAEAPAATPPPAADEDERWAHTIPQAETGCLLLSHPLMFVSSQTYFFHSAIFLFSHDATGSAGLIINRPTQYTVRETAGTEEQLQPELSDCQLYLGGDVGRETVHLLHGGAPRCPPAASARTRAAWAALLPPRRACGRGLFNLSSSRSLRATQGGPPGSWTRR